MCNIISHNTSFHTYRNKIEEVVNNTTSNEEAVTKEQVTEDVPIATTEPVNKKPTVVAKTRRRIVAKTSPMVAVAIESSSQVSSSSANSRTLSPARHVGKQSLAASLKVCSWWSGVGAMVATLAMKITQWSLIYKCHSRGLEAYPGNLFR